MNTVLIRTFVENRRQPLNRLDSTASQLDELCQLAPEFCVLVIGDERTHVTQRSQLLAGLVRSSIKREKIVTQLLKVADGDLLRMLDGLRRRRLNGRRVRELGLASLVPRPHFAQVAAHHRTRVVRIFKHLLGERTWSSIRRFLTVATPDGDRFVHAKVLRFAADTAKAREVLCFLAGLGFDQRPSTRRPWLIVPWFNKPERLTISFDNEGLRQSVAARRALYGGEGMPRETLSGIRGTYHPDASAKVLRSVAAPAKPRHLVDGPLTQALKRAMAENDSTSLDQLVDRASAIGSFPQVDVRAAVVLDLSSSTMSSGERLFHPAALGLALVGLLERTVRDLKLFQVGGSIVLDGHGVPRPSGATDLATAVLTAARTEPEAIFVVTDGYENARQGDVAEVVRGMQRLGIATEVYQVTPVIAAAEDLSRRRLGDSIPVVAVEHEVGFGELAARLLQAREPDHLSAETLLTVEQLLFRV